VQKAALIYNVPICVIYIVGLRFVYCFKHESLSFSLRKKFIKTEQRRYLKLITFATSRNILKRSGVKSCFFYCLGKIFPNIYSLLKKLNPNFLLKTKLSDFDLTMYVDPLDVGIGKDLFLYGRREDGATREFVKYLRPGQIVLDIGANIGYYVLIEAMKVGSTGKIYAIEPDPKNVQILVKNVEANNFSDIVDVTQGAISNHSGVAQLYVASRSNLHTLKKMPLMEEYVAFKDVIEVPCYTLDHFLKTKSVSPSDVDIMRMDVEGYEPYIFFSSADLFEKMHDFLLFIEIHPKLIRQNDEVSFEDFILLLKNLKFKILSAYLSLSSREDSKINIASIDELLDYDDAIELFLYKE